MAIQDEWGRDPTVQSMRRVFAKMDAVQKEILKGLNLSPFDSRLRRRRDEARALFERAWAQAIRKGVVLSEEDVASLYAHCLVRALSLDGYHVPHEAFPHHEEMIRFLHEGLK